MNLLCKTIKIIIALILAQKKVCELAKLYGVNTPLVLPMMPSRKNVAGCFFRRRFVLLNVLYIAKDGIYLKHIYKVVRHEMRHAWQWKHYPDLMAWWSRKSHRAIYRRYYFSDFCSLEADARRWAEGQCGRKDLLEAYSVDRLQFLYERGRL